MRKMIIKKFRSLAVMGAVIVASPVLLSLNVGAASGVAINDANFPDKGFQKYIKENYDKNNDGSLSTAEINQVTRIEPGYVEISDFTGLKYFPKLEYFVSYYDGVTEIDVSHNPELNDLRVTSRQLDSIDVSCNPKLEYFTVNYMRIQNITILPGLDVKARADYQTIKSVKSSNEDIFEAKDDKDRDLFGNDCHIVCLKTKKAGNAKIVIKDTFGGQGEVNVKVIYKDVKNKADFWYEPTYYLSDKDVVRGYDKQTLFKPANECTRAQMVTFLWRLKGSPEPKNSTCKFSDVKKTDYFYKAVLWGNENGIVEGYKDGTFGPQIICARRHAVTFLWRLAGKPAASTDKNKFKDVKAKDYFYNAVLWASEKGIVAGYNDGTFKPNGNCLRRQMVTFLYKYDKNLK
ncbi:MAG: S-layer homology domain-containing protein [Clostridiales bacterium]|nr:S-layer homology domain-containing protein [Clostridiales bacterium]